MSNRMLKAPRRGTRTLRRAALQAAIFAVGLHTIPTAAAPPSTPSTPITVETTLDALGSIDTVARFGSQYLIAVVDTGSRISAIPLTQAAALLAEHGATMGPEMQSTLANGTTAKMRTIYIAHVTLGSPSGPPVTVDNVLAAVVPDGATALIGENFLFAFSRFAFERGQLELTR